MVGVRAKRGDTLTLNCVRTDEDGNSVDLSSVSIACEMVGDGDSPVVFTVTKTDATNGAFNAVLSATVTEALPLRVYNCDIEFSVAGEIVSTETFWIAVEQDITNAD